MIRLILSGVQWGTDPITEQNPETGEEFSGVQLNLMDSQSGILVHVPFTGEPLAKLVAELAKGLTEEQRREAAPSFNGGVILPSDGRLPPGWEKGPQG